LLTKYLDVRIFDFDVVGPINLNNYNNENEIKYKETGRPQIGTIFYTSIELSNAYRKKYEDITTDLYSFGAIICYLLTNNHPFFNIISEELINGDKKQRFILDNEILSYFNKFKKIEIAFNNSEFFIGKNKIDTRFKDLKVIKFLIEIFEKTFIIENRSNHKEIIILFNQFYQNNHLTQDFDLFYNFNILTNCYNKNCQLYLKNIFINIETDNSFYSDIINNFQCSYCKNSHSLINILKFIIKKCSFKIFKNDKLLIEYNQNETFVFENDDYNDIRIDFLK
jgi:serine/threonine protein kinase